MVVKKLAYILAFFILLGSAGPALAAKSQLTADRYFIKSKGAIWKNSFNVRHTFDGGFTADLSDWQVRVAKLFGVEMKPVQKLSILPSDADIAEPEIVGTLTKTTSDELIRSVPTMQVPWGIGAIVDAPKGGDGVLVAVLDTGIGQAHPDLSRRISGCKNFTSLKAPFIDDACEDGNGHGTHIAGIIAADGGEDGLGIYGVVPKAELSILKVCNTEGVCFADDVAVAIREAVDAGANIIVISAGSDSESVLIEDAISYAQENNVLVVAAAGNDGPYAGSIDYPAAYQYVVSVGAVDDDMIVPEWSSRGDNMHTKSRVKDEGDIEFVAPGVNIESSWKDGEYAILSGTSMAAPHIAGLAALLWDPDAKNPVEAVREKLYEATIDLEPAGEDEDSGYGFPTLK